MGSLAGRGANSDAIVALSRLDNATRVDSATETALERLHTFLATDATDQSDPVLERAFLKASRIASAGGYSADGNIVAAQVYAADVVAGLAAEGDLDAADTQIAAGALAETCSMPLAAASLDLFLRTVSSPTLLELPPLVAAEIQLRLLLHLDLVAEASLWQRTDAGDVECILALGTDPHDRHVRAEARVAITGKSSIRSARRSLRTATIYRFRIPAAAVVARLYGDPRRDVRAYVDGAATAVSPLLEREWLLERNSRRERALLGTVEDR